MATFTTTTTSSMRSSSGWVRRDDRATTTTTTSFMRSGSGWVRRNDRATTLKRETATTIPPPPPTLCSLAVTGCGVAIGHDSRKTRGNQSVVQSLSTRLGILILLAFLNDSLDLVLDQSLLCHFLQLHKNILNVSNFVGNSKVVILYQKTVVHPFRKQLVGAPFLCYFYAAIRTVKCLVVCKEYRIRVTYQELRPILTTTPN